MSTPRRPRTSLLAVTLAVIAVAGAGCGSSGSNESSDTTARTTAPASTSGSTVATTTTTAVKALPDVCSLLDQDAAEQVVGVPLADGIRSGSGEESMCQYTSDPNGPTAQVEVFLGPGGPKKQLDIDKDTLHHDFTSIPSLGDEAYLEAGNVFVRMGDVWFSINIVALDPPVEQVQAGLETLATDIAAKL